MNKFYFFICALIVLVNGKAQSLYFPPTTSNAWDTISPQSLGYCQIKINNLYTFLETNNSRAFILLKDGKIILEKYFGSFKQSDLWIWASAGKTITAFMVGLAQQEGRLSISDTTSRYLGQGWTACTPQQEEKITIRHQLTMTSGLDEGVSDPFCTLDTCLIYKAEAGTRWAYHNAPYTLLDKVIENITGQTINNYITQKLLNPTGMTGFFLQFDYNNFFFSNARSMARFGILILNKGNWNGNQIMTDTAYFNQMVNTSQTLNQSYGYLWYLNGKPSFMLPIPNFQIVFPGSLFPNAPADMISAIGGGGQILNIVPSQNLIWLRLGEDPINPLTNVNDDIWKYINELQCSTGIDQEEVDQENFVQLFPNPCNDILNIRSDKQISKIEIFNIYGQVVRNTNPTTDNISISINDLANGFYVAKISLTNGKIWSGKIIKE